MVRLCLCLELGVEEPVLRSVVQRSGAEDLLKVKEALENRMAQSMPMQTQLLTSRNETDALESGYLI